MEYLRITREKTYTFGTWNVRTLNEEYKKKLVFSEIERENVDLVVLTETRLKETGETDLGKYTHFHNGRGSNRVSGVSIVAKKNLGKIEKLENLPDSDRIITRKLKKGKLEVIIIGVYWVTINASDKDKKELRSDFTTILEHCKDYELIILGDFNCHVGNIKRFEVKKYKKEFEEYEKIVGKYGQEKLDKVGKMLVDICKIYKLKIQNTFFNHEENHKYTYYNKEKTIKSLIDFFITKQETKLVVHDVLACRWLDCETDHIFVAGTVSFKTKGKREIEDEVVDKDDLEMRQYKTYLLHSETFRNSYNKHLDSVINIEKKESTKEMYNHLRNSVHLAAYDKLGVQDKDMFGELLWDKEIKKLREKRDLPFRPTFDSHFGKIQNEVWEGVCLAVDNVERNKRSKAAWNILQEILNKRSKTAMNKQPSHDLYKTVFENNRIVAEELEPGTEKTEKATDHTKKVTDHTIPISLKDVEKALVELDDDKWPVPDGISIQLLRNSSLKTKHLLTKLIQNIFNGEELPPKIGETYISNIIKIENSENYAIKNLQVHCIMRVMCFILKERIEKTFEKIKKTLTLPQLSYQDLTTALRQKRKKNDTKKCHFAFIDLKKAFFDVEYKKLFEILSKKFKKSETPVFLAVLQHLLKSNTIRVCIANTLSKKFSLSKGLTEQCILGPILLRMYIQEGMEKWNKKCSSYGLKIDNCTLSYVISNNQIIIAAREKTHFETMFKYLKTYFKEIGINLSDSDNLEQMELKFTKNGLLLKRDGICLDEASKRIFEARNAIAYLHPVIRDERISKKNKSRIFNTIIRSILMNGCETWTLNKEKKKYIDFLERSYWGWIIPRSIYAKFILRDGTQSSKAMKLDEWPECILNWDPNEAGGIGRLIQKWEGDIEEIRKNEDDSRKKLNSYLSG